MRRAALCLQLLTLGILVWGIMTYDLPWWGMAAYLAIFGLSCFVLGRITYRGWRQVTDAAYVHGYMDAQLEVSNVFNEADSVKGFAEGIMRAIKLRVDHDSRFQGVDAVLKIQTRGER